VLSPVDFRKRRYRSTMVRRRPGSEDLYGRLHAGLDGMPTDPAAVSDGVIAVDAP
jgi:hypothetical protein